MPTYKLQKKHFAKKRKNKSSRDALPPKTTSQKTNETSDCAHHNACTHYQHNALFYHIHVPTIPTSFQPHPPQCVPHPHTQLPIQYFLQYTTIHNHHHKARHLVFSQQVLLHPYSQSLHTSQNTTPHTITNPYLHKYKNTTSTLAPQIPHSQAQTKHTYSSQHHTATNLCAEQTQTTSTTIEKPTQQS